jgi:hypothetical protein
MIFKNGLQERSFALQNKGGIANFSSFSAVASAIVQVDATFSRETTAFLPGLALRTAWRHLALPRGPILAFN